MKLVKLLDLLNTLILTDLEDRKQTGAGTVTKFLELHYFPSYKKTENKQYFLNS